MVDEVRRGAPYLEPEELARIFSVEEFEPLAQERMPAEGYNFIAGAAGTGPAARGNLEAYTRWRFRQRALIDVSHIDTSVTVLGRTIALPILFAPTALHRFAHPDAELATARAAEALGTTMVISSGASVRFEEVGPTVTKPWFQLYWFTDRELTRDLVARAEASGFAAICVTVDAPVPAWREHEERLPPLPSPGIWSDNLPARRRPAARGRGRPDLAVARMAPLDHVAADPAQGDHDRGGRAPRRRARPGRDHRVEPRRPPARLVAGDARRAARDRRAWPAASWRS